LRPGDSQVTLKGQKIEKHTLIEGATFEGILDGPGSYYPPSVEDPLASFQQACDGYICHMAFSYPRRILRLYSVGTGIAIPF